MREREKWYVAKVAALLGMIFGVAAAVSALAWAGFNAPWWLSIPVEDPARAVALWIIHPFLCISGLVAMCWWNDNVTRSY